MLTLPPAVRVFIATEPADMRRSLDTLAMLAEQVIRQDPYSGHLFAFRNRSGDRLKILFRDRSGFCLWYKRLAGAGGAGGVLGRVERQAPGGRLRRL
jgi:transposase